MEHMFGVSQKDWLAVVHVLGAVTDEHVLRCRFDKMMPSSLNLCDEFGLCCVLVNAGLLSTGNTTTSFALCSFEDLI
jgi:hypothetical protein